MRGVCMLVLYTCLRAWVCMQFCNRHMHCWDRDFAIPFHVHWSPGRCLRSFVQGFCFPTTGFMP